MYHTLIFISDSKKWGKGEQHIFETDWKTNSKTNRMTKSDPLFAFSLSWFSLDAHMFTPSSFRPYFVVTHLSRRYDYQWTSNIEAVERERHLSVRRWEEKCVHKYLWGVCFFPPHWLFSLCSCTVHLLHTLCNMWSLSFCPLKPYNSFLTDDSDGREEWCSLIIIRIQIMSTAVPVSQFDQSYVTRVLHSLRSMVIMTIIKSHWHPCHGTISSSNTYSIVYTFLTCSDWDESVVHFISWSIHSSIRWIIWTCIRLPHASIHSLLQL